MEIKTKFSLGDKVAHSDGQATVTALRVEVTQERTIIAYQLDDNIYKEWDEKALKAVTKEVAKDQNLKQTK
ncbi:MAG: hypothetical protein UZ04_CHB001001461 [Chlorobi bacterium OLB4]|jgi:hypothetical protein|nr:MAG: hypothetical protein UZ04_CHB001001461 [Chlorobi bacterium OLB4]MBV6399582.1 hypothetical protein [Ignavibacteria bacterium]RIK47795.1 MAG: hypothetical protein DCC60_09485 [Ignavibacteriota bacterium]